MIMKIYRVTAGILIESAGKFYLFENSDWNEFVNDDDLIVKAQKLIESKIPSENAMELIETGLLPPIRSEEIWASGVTYFNSKLARQKESKDAGGGDFYAKVYLAERPELFFQINGLPGSRFKRKGADSAGFELECARTGIDLVY